MIRTRATRLGLLISLLASTGCMTLREIPRQEFNARAERRGVRVETRDGLLYEFDYASLTGDTLVGYRNHPESEGAADAVTVIRVPFADVQRLTSREVDWRRTGLIGGTVVATALTLGLNASLKHDAPTSGSGGGPFNP